MMKVKKNASTNSSGVPSAGRPNANVASQQKICTPFGIAIAMLDAVTALLAVTVLRRWRTRHMQAS